MAGLETQGMLIQIGDGASPEVFTTIADVVDFDGPGGEASVIDMTSLDSTAREKAIGLRDEGQMTLTINYSPAEATHGTLRTARADRTLTNFRITFTDEAPATTWTFGAYVLGFAISGGVDDKVSASVTLEITGAVAEA